MSNLLDEFEVIKEKNKSINAYITFSQLDDSISDGKLSGKTIAVKDTISTAGLRTTCASKMLENYVPPYDAHAVSLIKKHGAIIIGKANCDEFAMGSSTEHSAFGPTHNPHDLERVPGGSSGGSAAAVAGGLADLALGSDTGGSIRCPASFCGIVGLKPTYGLVSRYGLIAYGNSLEQIGPMAKNVYDCALLLECISDYDNRDATCVNTKRIDYTSHLEDDISGLKIAVPKEFFGPGTDSIVEKSVWNTIKKLESEGAIIEEINIESIKYSLAAYYIIAMSEASSNLARFDGLRYGLHSGKSKDWNELFSNNRKFGFGFEVKRRIILGTFSLSSGYFDEYYIKAQKVRSLITNDFKKVFSKFDVIVGPTMPTLAFKLGEKLTDPLSMYMSDIDTVSANLAGIPSISIPCGNSNSLPIGIQLMSSHFNEKTILNLGNRVEQIAGV
ncbi:MAG: Asp-tRNA(Asn)/Glu-tRNA(Gln) amidotransferase subunit GatA [Thaumarchaeota archaeon]|nr:Asp-tRNA(Asn)/Glu-tRNA(Gln) amidotransferase subunit GatA [Nitrososphaerota archaeon]